MLVLYMSENFSADHGRALSERIRSLSRARGYASDADVTDKAGLSSSAISDIKRGHVPTLGTLLALCQALDLYSLDELVGFSATTYFQSRPRIDRLLDDAGPTVKRDFYGLLGQ